MIRLIPDILYSTAEAAKLFSVDRRTIRRMARRIGKKPYVRFFTADEMKRMAVGE